MEPEGPGQDTPDRVVADGHLVSCCQTRPGKFVFIERGNSEGWIASDGTVDVTR